MIGVITRPGGCGRLAAWVGHGREHCLDRRSGLVVLRHQVALEVGHAALAGHVLHGR